MDFDLYKELGVERDASAAKIKAAYRRRARQTHPDMPGGGDREAFARAEAARNVLMDPERRRRYDESGTWEENQPDNMRVAALQVIEMHVGGIVNAYVQDGFNEQLDPRRMKLLDILIEKVQGEIDTALANIAVGQRMIAFYADMVTRFGGHDNFLGRSIVLKMREAEQSIERIHASIAPRVKAIDLLRTCTYRADEPPSPGVAAYYVNIGGVFIPRAMT